MYIYNFTNFVDIHIFFRRVHLDEDGAGLENLFVRAFVHNFINFIDEQTLDLFFGVFFLSF